MSGSGIDAHGWLQEARRCLSPNQDQRPEQADIELLVIHCISLPAGRYGLPFIDALFQNRLPPGAHASFPAIASLRVSAHLLIDRAGRPTQYVPFSARAWHAGVSEWNHRQRCNDFSVGIELEGIDGDGFTPAQYRTLVRTVQRLHQRYPGLAPSHIAGHDEIAPGRKNDPGPGFDWPGFCRMLGITESERRAHLSALRGETS